MAALSSSSSSSSISSTSSASSTSSFCVNFGITEKDFADAFENLHDGTFQLKQGWSLAFTHAVLTTGDNATTIATPVRTGRSGELWRDCTGHSVRDEKCCVHNCPNKSCMPGNRQPARATAHVYAKTQTPQHDIRFMILIPTCSACNNAWQAASSETNFPPTGEDAHVLYTETGARMIFIKVSDQTVDKKGRGKGTTSSSQGKAAAMKAPGKGSTSSSTGQGKAPAKAAAKKTPVKGSTSYATGQGGGYKGPYYPGPPPNARIVGD